MSEKDLLIYIQKMSQALEDEIECLKKGGGGKRVPIIEGEFQFETGRKYIYRFIIDTEYLQIDDSPGLLLIPSRGNYGDKTIKVYISNVEATEVSIASDEFLGEYIAQAVLVVSPYYLLEILKTRLEEIKNKQFNVNCDLAVGIFNGENPKKISEKGFQPLQGLDIDQNRALEHSLKNNITFIWGPPGTGKTHTIAKIIEVLVKKNQTVLFASHTNSAIDTALIKTYELLSKNSGKEFLEGGKVIRFGTPHRKDPKLEEILLEKVVEKRSKNLFLEKEKLDQRKQKNEKIFNEIKKILEIFREKETFEKKLIEKETEIKRLEEEILNLGKKINIIKERLLREKKGLERILKGNFVIKLFNPSPTQFRDKIEGIGRLLESKETDLYEVQKRKQNGVKEKEKIRIKMLDLKKEIQSKVDPPDKSIIEKDMEKAKGEIENLNNRLAQIDREINEMTEKVLKESLVIGTTLSKTFLNPEIYQQEFDTVIIDEASIAPLPNLFFNFCKAGKNVIISGDFKQLPPIANAKTDAVKEWLKKDIYEKVKIIENINSRDYDSRVIMLKQQRRMRPEITQIINPFYNNSLKINLEGKEEKKNYEHPFDRGIIFCDTSVIDPWCARAKGGFSRYNLYSAVLSVNLAERVLEKGAEEIGIITPFSAQANLIRKLVMDRGLQKSIKSSTVHQFQGDEKEFIIIDTVDGYPMKKVSVLMRGEMDSEAMRLINVAITRAKFGLVVINNYEYFRAKMIQGNSVFDALKRIYNSGLIIPAEEFLPSYSQVKNQTEIDMPEGKEFLVKDAGGFYRAFINDLYRAKERVLIISPFISRKRLSFMMDALRHLADKGVEVIIFSRPPEQQPEGKNVAMELIEAIKKLKIKIDLQRNIHEKIALIDKEICWFGSLNILSQSQSSERMMRFNSVKAVEQLYKVLGASGFLNLFKTKEKKKSIQEKIKKELRGKMPPPICCGEKMDLRFGKYGPFYGCADFPKDKKITSIPLYLIENVIEELKIPCPDKDCKGKMRFKRYKQGSFLSCGNYPDCRRTIDLSKSF